MGQGFPFLSLCSIPNRPSRAKSLLSRHIQGAGQCCQVEGPPTGRAAMLWSDPISLHQRWRAPSKRAWPEANSKIGTLQVGPKGSACHPTRRPVSSRGSGHPTQWGPDSDTSKKKKSGFPTIHTARTQPGPQEGFRVSREAHALWLPQPGSAAS